MKHAILWTCMFASFAASAETTIDPASIYSSHCAACHGADRLGGMGPALLPESLERLRPDDLLDVMRNGINKIAVALGGDAPRVSEGTERYLLGVDGQPVFS